MKTSSVLLLLRCLGLGRVAFVTFFTLAFCGACGPALEIPKTVDELHRVFRERAKERIASAGWARADGYAYSVDIGHMMMYAALEKDQSMYVALRDEVKKHLLIDSNKDEYTRGFVLWRYKRGVPADASGTTEALRLAEGFWRGAIAFGQPEDRKTALLVLDGYRRHEFVDQGIWLIRNYFNLGTRSFASNSFLVDYDPDFVQEVANETRDAKLKALGARSLELVRKAIAKSGLLYSMIQPEVATLLPGGLAFFSPNDIVKLQNCSTVAERVAIVDVGIGRAVLNFAISRLPDLTNFYYGRTGEKAESKENAALGPAGFGSLLRLALKVGDTRAANILLPLFLEVTQRFLHAPYSPELYIMGEVLLTFSALRRATL